MLRNIGAVAVGVLAGAIVIFVVEAIGHIFFPPPEGLDIRDPAARDIIMSQIPTGAKIAVVVAWFAGVFAGGVAALMVARRWAPAAWVVAGTLFAMALITMVQIPHPWWMMAGAVAATLLGGFGAIRVMGGSYGRPPEPAPTPGL